MKARRGEYVAKRRMTVGRYLDEWIEAHAMSIKPKTLKDYRDMIDAYQAPHR